MVTLHCGCAGQNNTGQIFGLIFRIFCEWGGPCAPALCFVATQQTRQTISSPLWLPRHLYSLPLSNLHRMETGALTSMGAREINSSNRMVVTHLTRRTMQTSRAKRVVDSKEIKTHVGVKDQGDIGRTTMME